MILFGFPCYLLWIVPVKIILQLLLHWSHTDGVCDSVMRGYAFHHQTDPFLKNVGLLNPLDVHVHDFLIYLISISAFFNIWNLEHKREFKLGNHKMI